MRYLILLVCCLAWGGEPPPLKPVPTVGLGLLPGPLLPAGTAVPATASALTIGNEVYYFFDLDGNGQPWDAMGIQGENFIVPVPDRLLLTNGQWLLDKTTGTVARDVLPLPDRLVAECALLTRLRIRCGLRPVWIDAAGCEGAAAHIAYLEKNRIPVGLEMHREDPTKPGYTEEGRMAAGSMIQPTPRSMTESITAWATTALHSTVISSPMIVSVQVGYGRAAALLGNVGMDKSVTLPMRYPQAGGANTPTAFNRVGEIPNPMAGDTGAGRGFPIYFQLPPALVPKKGAVPDYPTIKEATLVDSRGRPVAGKSDSPAGPSHPTGVKSVNYLFLPDRPLTPRTQYRVRFVLSNDHAEEWSFTTGDR